MKTVFLLFLPICCLAQTITPNYGELDQAECSQAFTQSAAVGELYAVANFFTTEGVSDAIVLLNEEGLIVTTLPLTIDNQQLDPMLYSDGTTLNTTGLAATLPLSLDSVALANRTFTVREYGTSGDVLSQLSEAVEPTEIGLRGGVFSVGINTNIVYYQPLSWIGAASEDWVVQVQENTRININEDNTVDLLPGQQNSVSIFNRNDESLVRVTSENEWRTLADLAIVDDHIWLYALRGDSLETLTSVHRLAPTGAIMVDTFQADAYIERGLVHYAEVMEGQLLEAIGLAGGPFGSAIRATTVQVRD
ncbi:MAG: hypothetical protein AAGJ82_13375, partial [Bacteroidota bacterium]